MKAILLAAGLGTRLRPITNSIPKCLVPFNGKPLLFIWVEQLVAAGVKHIYINTHYFSDAVEQAIESHPLNEKVTLVYEPELLGTAGTVKNILTQFDFNETSVFIAHADNVCLCDWPAFFSYLADEKSQVAMMAFESDNPQSCGILEVDAEKNLLAFHEKVANPPGNLANGAVYLFKNEALKTFTSLKKEAPDISLDVIPSLIEHTRVWPTDGYLRDIGTPESYKQAQADLLKLAETYHIF